MRVIENATHVFLKVLTVRTHLTSLKAFHTVKIRMTMPRALQKRVQLANDVSRRRVKLLWNTYLRPQQTQDLRLRLVLARVGKLVSSAMALSASASSVYDGGASGLAAGSSETVRSVEVTVNYTKIRSTLNNSQLSS